MKFFQCLLVLLQILCGRFHQFFRLFILLFTGSQFFINLRQCFRQLLFLVFQFFSVIYDGIVFGFLLFFNGNRLFIFDFCCILLQFQFFSVNGNVRRLFLGFCDFFLQFFNLITRFCHCLFQFINGFFQFFHFTAAAKQFTVIFISTTGHRTSRTEKFSFKRYNAERMFVFSSQSHRMVDRVSQYKAAKQIFDQSLKF